jgi:pteridine reductase
MTVLSASLSGLSSSGGSGKVFGDIGYYVIIILNKTAPNTPRKALVTGAAARIGAATAMELHRRACDVLLHYNSNGDAAEQLADRLNAVRPGSASVACADLSAEKGVAGLAEQVRSRWDRLDILVNNASRFYPTTTGQTAAWQWDDLLNSNLKGPYFLVQELITELRDAKGAVINLLDVHAERPMHGHAVYCISKAGLAMMTLALAKELGPDIRVNGVSPGAILWPEKEPPESEKEAILGATALGRLGEPRDIAGAVAYLALDAPYVTGQILAVDGGRSLNI